MVGQRDGATDKRIFMNLSGCLADRPPQLIWSRTKSPLSVLAYASAYPVHVSLQRSEPRIGSGVLPHPEVPTHPHGIAYSEKRGLKIREAQGRQRGRLGSTQVAAPEVCAMMESCIWSIRPSCFLSLHPSSGDSVDRPLQLPPRPPPIAGET